MIEARGLRKYFNGRAAVDGIDLGIREGECFGLLGPNGAGKTTTLRMLLGLTIPTSGQLRVAGFAIPARAAEMRARAGVVPQQDNLDPDFSVRENLIVYARYFGLRSEVVSARLPKLLEYAALEGRADTRITTLSGGMRRRLILARALINDPVLLFLDEPTTGLDPQARHLIWRRLRQLRDEGKTLVLTTHYMDEAQRLCDRLAILDNGRILDMGSPAELIARHVESQVVEVHGRGADEWFAAQGRALARRSETAGETIFCYTDDARALSDALAAAPGLSWMHRPGNLEDVFLRLTGRELRDQ